MANTINNVHLVGRLGGNPEVTITKNGHALAKFSVATDRYMGPGRDRKVDWHNIVCWEDRAKYAEGYLHKGDQVSITGNLHENEWRTPDGAYRSGSEVNVTQIDRLRQAPTPVMAEAELEPEAVAAD